MSQTLELRIETEELSLGGECQLLCTVSRLNSDKLHWEKNGEKLSVPSTVSVLHYNINALKQSDEGTYTCVLTSNGVVVKQDSLPLPIPRKLE